MMVTFTQGYRLRANPGLELANAFGVIALSRNIIFPPPSA